MRRLAILFVVLFALLPLTISSALAVEKTNGNVTVTLNTNQAAYAKDSDIHVTLTVKNQEDVFLSPVTFEMPVINGYSLQGENSTLQIVSVPSGEEVSLTAVYQSAGNVNSLPTTGDASSIGLWIMLMLCAMIGLTVMSVRSSRARKMLALLLCAAFSSAICFQPAALAASESIAQQNWPQKMRPFARRMMSRSGNQTQDMELVHSFTLDGESIEMKVKVSYTLTSPDDNLNDDYIDRGDIQNLIALDRISVVFGANGSIGTIDGSITNDKIRSADDAADVLNSASQLFSDGFYADKDDIQTQTDNESSNVYYRYSPTKNGIPVLGSQIVISANSNGDMTSLTNTYTDQIDHIDTYSAIEENAAVLEAKTAFFSEEGVRNLVAQAKSANPSMAEDAIRQQLLEQMDIDTKLVIYAADNTLPVALVYAVRLSTKQTAGEGGNADSTLKLPLIDVTYYVYASGPEAGLIHSSASGMHGWSTVTLECKDLLNVKRTFTAQEESGKYRLKDTTRKIETYKTTYGGFLWTVPQLPGKLVESTGIVNEYFDKVDVSAHANISKVYDYYKNVLGRNSFDNHGATIKVSTEYDNVNFIFTGNYYNAFWSPNLQQIVIGDDGNLAAGLDVLGHEFTHAVVNYVVGNGRDVSLTYQGESGALNESLADILGSLIEDKSGSGRWLMGEDTEEAIRDMSDPSRYNQPEHYNNRYTGTDDNGGVHINSGIFNFAAYKMMTDSRTSAISDKTWAKVFYQTMFRLATDATFLQARGAVISAAKDLGFNGPQQQAIKDAFDAVGIKEPNAVRIVLTWGAVPQDLDSHLVGPGVNGERFHVYYGDCTYHEDGTYYSENSPYYADLDYDDVTSYGPEVTTIHTLKPGTYYFYVHDYTTYDDASSLMLSQSGATIKVYNGNEVIPIATYQITPGNRGTIWNVFELTIGNNKNISVRAINTYGNSVTYH